jgi:hypothetical protein
VFPLGQRHLRGIDEPERVYEIAIDELEPVERLEPPPGAEPEPGVPAKQVARSEDLGARIAASVQEKVLRALEGKLDRVEGSGGTPRSETGGVDDIAARVESLTHEIDARVKAALAKKGISSDD